MFKSFLEKYGEQIKKIAIGAVLAGIGAGVTVILKAVSDIDFGEYTVFVAAGISVIVNILRKFGIPVVVATASVVRKAIV